MKEIDVRKAIGLDPDLTTAQKYTLIMMCLKLDWETWTGRVSALGISKISAQSDRQVKRHLSKLKASGWIMRISDRRTDKPQLNHRSDTALNTLKAQAILSTYSVNCDTVGHSDILGNSGESVTVMDSDIMGNSGESVTMGYLKCHSNSGESVTIEDSDIKGNSVNCDTMADPKCHSNSGESVTMTVAKVSHNINYIQPIKTIENKNSSSEDDEAGLDPAREREEEDRAENWDDIMSRHEPPEPVEFQDGKLFYLSHIKDETEYRRQVQASIDHNNAYDIRRALFAANGELYTLMISERISPRSAIDWVTIQASGELPAVKTQPVPPPKPTTIVVTPERQEEILKADLAWMNPSYRGRKTNGDGW